MEMNLCGNNCAMVMGSVVGWDVAGSVIGTMMMLMTADVAVR